MKIYTRKGDQGQTRLVGGRTVSKTDLRIESYGSVDELNSLLGFVQSELGATIPDLSRELAQIQNELFCVGSLLGCEDPQLRASLPALPAGATSRLEGSIDRMSAELPELKQFILPGGTRAASSLHIARTVCRRAERRTVELHNAHPEHEPELMYLNRLSDYLFTAARFANLKAGVTDQPWVKP
jgi:cob(I)alamin adenosyltransferase